MPTKQTSTLPAPQIPMHMTLSLLPRNLFCPFFDPSTLFSSTITTLPAPIFRNLEHSYAASPENLLNLLSKMQNVLQTQNVPRTRICITAPCKPKNIHSGWEQSTQTCMPALAPLWLKCSSPSEFTMKPKMSPLWRGTNTLQTAQNSFLSTKDSGLYGRSLGLRVLGSQVVTP